MILNRDTDSLRKFLDWCRKKYTYNGNYMEPRLHIAVFDYLNEGKTDDEFYGRK